MFVTEIETVMRQLLPDEKTLRRMVEKCDGHSRHEEILAVTAPLREVWDSPPPNAKKEAGNHAAPTWGQLFAVERLHFATRNILANEASKFGLPLQKLYASSEDYQRITQTAVKKMGEMGFLVGADFTVGTPVPQHKFIHYTLRLRRFLDHSRMTALVDLAF